MPERHLNRFAKMFAEAKVVGDLAIELEVIKLACYCGRENCAAKLVENDQPFFGVKVYDLGGRPVAYCPSCDVELFPQPFDLPRRQRATSHSEQEPPLRLYNHDSHIGIIHEAARHGPAKAVREAGDSQPSQKTRLNAAFGFALELFKVAGIDTTANWGIDLIMAVLTGSWNEGDDDAG